MKRRILYLIIIIIAIGILMAGYKAYNYYGAASEREPYKIESPKSDTLRIAYIGDSWAFFHRPYDERMSQMATQMLQRPTTVSSYGICGLTSKEIYEALFDEEGYRSFISRGYDFCFISAGINDSYRKLGLQTYQQNMDYLIRFLLANQITPILLEMPDYDILKAYEWQTFSRKTLRQLSMLLTGTEKDCRVAYREALDEVIRNGRYENQVGIVRYQSWNNNYEDDMKSLYQNDGMHLNSQGYEKLDSSIIQVIANTTNYFIITDCLNQSRKTGSSI